MDGWKVGEVDRDCHQLMEGGKGSLPFPPESDGGEEGT